jgi:hypothetical protein
MVPGYVFKFLNCFIICETMLVTKMNTCSIIDFQSSSELREDIFYGLPLDAGCKWLLLLYGVTTKKTIIKKFLSLISSFT